MPKVMKTGGINISEDVVRIRDLAPAHPLRRKENPPPDAEPLPQGLPQDEDVPPHPGQAEAAADFEEEDFGGQAPITAAQSGLEGISTSGIKEEIIQAAMAEAGRILEDAVRKAEAARDEELAKVQMQADQMRQEAADAGRREGMAAAMQDIQGAVGQLEEAIASFEADRAGFETEYEGQLKWLALEIAEKVLAKKVAADDGEMLEMVEKAVQNVRNESWIRVEVAQEMTNLIDKLGTAFEGQENIEVNAVPAPEGTVQIETPSGVVDASLQTQLANLRDYFAAN